MAEIVQYALRKGVRVIPEIDSPAHTQAWGRSPQLQNITLNCDGEPYTGQFDPTLDLTYQVVGDVLKEINEMFIDQVVHFGGDEVTTSCWDKRPSIKEWMGKNNISNYSDLQVYYRTRQKELWRKISNKNASYWANEEINLPTQPDDYIHWWGVSTNVKQLENRTNNIILSNYDITYLDIGYGGRTGFNYGTTIETWRKMYSFEPNIPNIKGKILGGEACLWSEVNNQFTQPRKLWLRASSVAERLWNSKISTASFRDIVNRLAEHGRRLRRRGIPFSPITVELCERDSSYCFE